MERSHITSWCDLFHGWSFHRAWVQWRARRNTWHSWNLVKIVWRCSFFAQSRLIIFKSINMSLYLSWRLSTCLFHKIGKISNFSIGANVTIINYLRMQRFFLEFLGQILTFIWQILHELFLHWRLNEAPRVYRRHLDM